MERDEKQEFPFIHNSSCIEIIVSFPFCWVDGEDF